MSAEALLNVAINVGVGGALGVLGALAADLATWKQAGGAFDVRAMLRHAAIGFVAGATTALKSAFGGAA